jgi:hypothetical protein
MSDETTRYLVVNGEGLVRNVIVGFVEIRNRELVEQTQELAAVGIGWTRNASGVFEPPATLLPEAGSPDSVTVPEARA